MTEPFRLPRPDRSKPHRSAFTAYRRSDRGAAPKTRRAGPLVSSEDVVIEAVKLGYKIADDQIQKGQDFARRLRGAALRSEVDEMGSLVDQALRLAKQLAILFVEMAETSVQAPSVARNLAKSFNEGSREAPAAAAGRPAPQASPRAAHGSVPVSVKSSRATRVSVVLYETLSTCPDVYPLQSKTKNVGALHDLVFQAGSKQGDYVLRVDISDEQPAGTYRGYAIDPADGRPLGFIEVTIESP